MLRKSINVFFAYENLLNKKTITPPKLGLKNWRLLKQHKDFLLLSAREPLKEICAKMSTFEDLDDTITKAHDDGRYAQLATAIFQRTLEKRMHENLVSLIMTEEETRLFKNELQSKNN